MHNCSVINSCTNTIVAENKSGTAANDLYRKSVNPCQPKFLTLETWDKQLQKFAWNKVSTTGALLTQHAQEMIATAIITQPRAEMLNSFSIIMSQI
jgi:hypothetical protein